jgi:uncharacterized protein (DUF342 family)
MNKCAIVYKITNGGTMANHSNIEITINPEVSEAFENFNYAIMTFEQSVKELNETMKKLKEFSEKDWPNNELPILGQLEYDYLDAEGR